MKKICFAFYLALLNLNKTKFKINQTLSKLPAFSFFLNATVKKSLK